MKLCHFVQKMKKNTLKDGLDAKKDAKRDAKSSFCCSGHMCQDTELGDCFQAIYQNGPLKILYIRISIEPLWSTY